MRCWLDRPAIVTHRSRGNDSTATCDVAGLTRHIMIVSLRSPRVDPVAEGSCLRRIGIDAAVVVGTGDQEVLGLGFGRRERRRRAGLGRASAVSIGRWSRLAGRDDVGRRGRRIDDRRGEVAVLDHPLTGVRGRRPR